MSEEATPGGVYRSPSAMQRIREKKADVARRVSAGDITAEAGAAEIVEFQGMVFAHIREHGSD